MLTQLITFELKKSPEPFTCFYLFSFQGLFQAVIPQSGCALAPWAIYRPPHKPKTYAMELATKVNCDTSSSSILIECLRSKWAPYLIRINVTVGTLRLFDVLIQDSFFNMIIYVFKISLDFNS